MVATMTATVSPKVQVVIDLYEAQFHGSEAAMERANKQYIKAEQALTHEQKVEFWQARHRLAVTLREAEHCQRIIQIDTQGSLTFREATALVAALRALDITGKVLPYTNLVRPDAEAEANATQFRVLGKDRQGYEYIYRDADDLVSVLRRVGRALGYEVAATPYTAA